jgi:hypothetical protein
MIYTIFSRGGQIIPSVGLMTAELIHRLVQSAPRLAELYHAGLQVIKRPFYKATLLLVMGQEVVPERML